VEDQEEEKMSDGSNVWTPRRRDLAALVAGTAGLAMTARLTSAAETPSGDRAMGNSLQEHGSYMQDLPRLRFVMVLFPQLTAVDLVAPQLLFATMMNTEVHIAGKSRDVVLSDSGIGIQPSTTFEECPRDIDVVCVPGGPRGTAAAIRDDATLRFDDLGCGRPAAGVQSRQLLGNPGLSPDIRRRPG
jgi:hypothetical protein